MKFWIGGWGLALGLALCARAATGTGLGLGWDGSVAEAAYFAHQRTRSHPAEWVKIVACDPAGTDAKKIRSALAVYSADGKVFVHAGPSGEKELAISTADDAALREALTPFVAELANTWVGEGPLADAVQRASADADGREFPLALATMTGTRKKPDGTRESVSVESLIFDWEGRHYAYRPGAGCSVLDIPKNEPRGHLQACIKYGDLIEAVLFAASLRIQDPNTNVRVSFPRRRAGGCTVGSAGAYYTADNRVRVYNIFFGDSPLGEFTAADFPNDLHLSHTLWMVMSQRMQGPLLQLRGAEALAVRLDEVYTVFKSAVPGGLPGDTPELQLKRAAQLLRKAGVSVDLASDLRSLEFTFDGQRYYYDQEDGGRSLPIVTGGVGNALMTVTRNYQFFEKDVSQGRAGNIPEKMRAEMLLSEEMPSEPQYAREILEPLLMKGDADAALTLARYFQVFATTDEEYALALKANRVAALAGFPEAVYNYGALLASGHGAPVDVIEGMAWMLAGPRDMIRERGLGVAWENGDKSPAVMEAAQKRSVEVTALLAKHELENQKHDRARN